jgi:RimJ/RimL family protein N-acetyltransferase
MTIKLRPAVPADSAELLRWRNDPDTRAASLDRGAVTLAEHERWYAAALGNAARQILIAEESNVPVGMVRFDRREGDELEISVNLAPEARGRGLGAEIIVMACRQQPVGTVVIARVRPDNLASVKVFGRAGFVRTAESAQDYIVMKWRRE